MARLISDILLGGMVGFWLAVVVVLGALVWVESEHRAEDKANNVTKLKTKGK